MKALIIPLPFSGHLNPIIKLARELLTHDFEVVFCGNQDVSVFTNQQSFKYIALHSLPFGISMDGISHQDSKNKWLENLIDRWTDKVFNERKTALESIVSRQMPTHIFIDTFLSTDFIILYPLITKLKIKVFFLQTMLPTHYDGITPPLNSALSPQKDFILSKKAWDKYFWERSLQLLKQNLLYLGKSDRAIVNQKFNIQKIPDEFAPVRNKVFHVGFKNIPELILAPKEFDFLERKLLDWQQYLGVMVDINRVEIINEDFVQDLNHFQNKYKGLIYCSLGTVNNIIDIEKARQFFEYQIEVFKTLKDYGLIISVGKAIKKQLQSLPQNVLVYDTLPQLYLLERTQLFITHGGLNSTLESILKGVPMLVCPIIGKYDTKGNAARVVYHGLGMIENFEKTSVETSKTKISKLINDESYKNNISTVQNKLKKVQKWYFLTV